MNARSGVGSAIAGFFAPLSVPWKLWSLVVLVAGGYATYLRFFRGLGASTNLTDQFPWGLWIGFDVLCGVGLAAGGFTICAMVHILRIETYRPLLRPAVLTAFIGYLMVVGGLAFDLGHPLRIWHPIIMWNHHSVMFEIGWCVTLYTTVLAAEFSAMVFERFKMRRSTHVAHTLAFPLAVASVLLSMLHQSSLGSLFLIAPGRLHELWYTPFLPLLFFLTAMGAGLAMVIVETNLSARVFNHPVPTVALRGAARVAAVVLGFAFVLRFAELIRTGALTGLNWTRLAPWLFSVEMLLGFVVPIVLFALPKIRRNRVRLYRTAQLAVLGFVIARLNTSVTGFEFVSGITYVPSWTEVAVTAMIVTLGVWAVYLCERFLPVLEEDEEAPARERRWKAYTGTPALATPR